MKRIMATATLVVALVLGPIAAEPASASSRSYCGHYSHQYWSGWHLHWWWQAHDSKVVYGGSYYDYGHYHRYALFQYHNGQWVHDYNFDIKCS